MKHIQYQIHNPSQVGGPLAHLDRGKSPPGLALPQLVQWGRVSDKCNILSAKAVPVPGAAVPQFADWAPGR